MATFLDLCRRVHRYARIGVDAPGTAPVTVIDQTGVLAEIVGWVQDAWDDIQHDQPDWLFRQAQAQVPVNAGVNDVDVGAAIADYEQLRPFAPYGDPRCVLVSPAPDAPATRTPVWFLDWTRWRGGIYARGGGATAAGQPCACTLAPDGHLHLYPIPDADIVLTLGYQKAVQTLAADAEVPDMPARHHAAIVWRALMYYADTRDKTQESYQKWERRRVEAMRELYREQLPEMHF